MAQPLLNVTELDFDQIKANLRAYFLRQDSPIKDWNYDGSGLNMLLDVLAYNTHYNAILAHLNLNESFIDTAQLRSSVISQAKLLGYVPTSIKAATVTVTAAFSSSGSPIAGSKITIPDGSKFAGTSPNGSFTFVTQGITADVGYVTTSGAYVTTLSLIQGVSRSQTYQVDNTLANQRFTIDDPSADISTLKVNVFDNQNMSKPTPYLVIDQYIADNGGDIANVTGTAAIYYLSLNSTGTYEVTFGDGVLGQALNNLNVVQLTYISTQGPLANGISNFTYADSTLQSSPDSINTANVTVTAAAFSAGGADQESMDSIRINAPAALIAQNRAVTANDYISLIQKQYTAITSTNVWGGEDEVTYDPINAAKYAGKVFISYTSSTAVSSGDVINYLKNFKVMSVTPQYYAPDYVNLYLNVNSKYNPNLTTKGSSQLANNASYIINAYNSSSLQSFTGVFRHSNLLRQIDTSDPSILNSDIQVSFYKNYPVNVLSGASDAATVGIAATPNGMVNTFGNTLNGSANQVNSIVSSDGFTISQVLMPSQQPILVYGTYSSTSPIITLASSPGTGTTATNTLTHPYLVYGATVQSSTGGGFMAGTAKIISINNTGSFSTITVNANSTLAWLTASTNAITITPPAGVYYLRDGVDPSSSSTRRLFMSTYSSAVIASDPKYTSTGSDIHIGTVYPSTGKIELYRYFTGTVGSQPAAGLSLLDNSYGGIGSWSTNQFTNCVLYITAGQGFGNSAVISTNSGNILSWTSPSITLDSSSQYMVIRSCIDTTTANTLIKIYSRPASNDVAPSRHQLLAINMGMTSATATPDSFAQAGVLGANSYTTFSRDPQS
jgi:hypothetical protein